MILVAMAFMAFVEAFEDCPKGWTSFKYPNHEEYCYKLVEESHWFTWHQENCLKMNATLVSIHSLDENDFVAALSKPYYSWIGLSRSSDDSKWKYEDGTPLDFTHWDSEGK